MLSLALFFIVIALMPAYFFSTQREKFISDKLVGLSLEPVPELSSDLSANIKELELRIEMINKNKLNEYFITQNIIDIISSKKTAAIKINRISYQKKGANKEIVIAGIASSREDLLDFRRSFEQDANFKKVDLPISNFIKGSNIMFHLVLIPA